MRGRDSGIQLQPLTLTPVSIHAPVRGRDVAEILEMAKAKRFNPRARAWARLLLRNLHHSTRFTKDFLSLLLIHSDYLFLFVLSVGSFGFPPFS